MPDDLDFEQMRRKNGANKRRRLDIQAAIEKTVKADEPVQAEKTVEPEEQGITDLNRESPFSSQNTQEQTAAAGNLVRGNDALDFSLYTKAMLDEQKEKAHGASEST